jgi:hypothetical protein
MPQTPSPTYERLRKTIAKRMRMSHVYQPLMLMELLGRRSPAPAQDVARRILGEYVTQIDYYTERVKRMVGKVLTGNGITRYERGIYDLVGGEELSDAGTSGRRPAWRSHYATSCCSCAASASMPSECSAARRWAVCSRKSLRLRPQEPPPHPDQRLDQSPGAHPRQGPLRMLRRRLLLSKPRTKGPWKWTTSCPETMAVRTTSSTCRPSACAAMPAHSKAQAVDQLFNRAAQLAGHVLENLPQGADP